MTHESPDREIPDEAGLWALDPAVAMLNHGSFGACPIAVLEHQQRLRRMMEAEPVRFFLREMPPLWDQSRQALAQLLGARAEDLVFVPNATAGVNSVLRSLRFEPGDELLTTNHSYNACGNVARYVAQRAGATLVVVDVPLPVESSQQVIDAVLARATDRTRIAMLDHVTSPTAVIFPIEEIVRRLGQRGIDALVDGAHGPGMLPLDLGRIGAAYYTGNCHKWLCSPKGAGFLHVRQDRQEAIQPPVISHGFNQSRPDYTRFQDAFDWPGTADPTAWLCVAHAIGLLERLVDGGLPELMRRNRQMALAARRMLCERLGLRAACSEEMIGAMAAVQLPEDTRPSTDPILGHRLSRHLLDEFGIEVPVFYWPDPPRALLRISAQVYNHRAQYERLTKALESLLPRLYS